jgi:hypothetical protein
MFSDLPGVECIVDDILVWGENDEQHDCRVRQMLQRCRQMNFKLNSDKLGINLAKYCTRPRTRLTPATSVGAGISCMARTFSGLTFNPSLLITCPTYWTSGARSSNFDLFTLKFIIPNLSDVSDPLRILVKNDVQWHWNREQQQSFDELK